MIRLYKLDSLQGEIPKSKTRYYEDNCMWVKTKGFLAQSTSPNLEKKSKMSCEGKVGHSSLHVGSVHLKALFKGSLQS